MNEHDHLQNQIDKLIKRVERLEGRKIGMLEWREGIELLNKRLQVVEGKLMDATKASEQPHFNAPNTTLTIVGDSLGSCTLPIHHGDSTVEGGAK